MIGLHLVLPISLFGFIVVSYRWLRVFHGAWAAPFALLTLSIIQPKTKKSHTLDDPRVLFFRYLFTLLVDEFRQRWVWVAAMHEAVKNTIKILTVEDDASQTEALKEALIVAQIICVEILEAEDGDQAMAFLHQEYPHVDAPQPDLIFLSNHLPDRTGPEIIKELQKDRRLRTIPVALFSEDDPTASQNFTFPENCHLFMRPKSCDEWIFVLRCVEDVWVTLLNMAGRPRL